MLIDWFTVGAQILNFLVLVWLLKRFLYAPILKAIDDREKRIARQLSDVQSERTKVQQQHELYVQKQATLEQERQGLMDQAKQEAEVEKNRIIESARQIAKQFSDQQKKQLLKDQQTLMRELKQQTQQEVFLIARQALNDLADQSVEERMVTKFLNQLEQLDDATKNEFIDSIASELSTPDTNEPMKLRMASSFALSEARQREIQATVAKHFNTDIELAFEVNTELMGGIELTYQGQKLAWNLSEYLDVLETRVQAQIAEQVTERERENHDADSG